MHNAQGRVRRIRSVAVAATVAVAGLTFTATASAEPSFVVGDQNAALGSSVTFWGAQWWKLNSLSGGTAPASFKGYADTVAGSCGGSWTTYPGNSSDPPAGPLPGLIEVLVASHVTKSGRIISGDTSAIVLVETNLGYQGDPGHPGTGTVVGVVCSVAAEEKAREEKLREEEKRKEEEKLREEEERRRKEEEEHGGGLH
jgi:hypothetical protein